MTMIGALPVGRIDSISRGVLDAVDEALRRSESTFRSPRMFDAARHQTRSTGCVRWKPASRCGFPTMTLAGLIGGPLFFTWGALALFLATTAVTVCLGHSLGMHRRLIHRSYDCPLWLERLFVYLGTLVGMAGPYGMIRQHDIRDWAQRKPACHPYLAHRSSILRDGYWQLHCELQLAHPPHAGDGAARARRPLLPVHRAHLDGAAAALGGPVLRARRHAVAGLGHRRAGCRLRDRALAGRLLRPQPRPALLAHRGRGRAGLQCALLRAITMGEAWHNNHHAFPGSARLGLDAGEIDPGWWVLWRCRRRPGLGRQDARDAAAPAQLVALGR